MLGLSEVVLSFVLSASDEVLPQKDMKTFKEKIRRVWKTGEHMVDEQHFVEYIIALAREEALQCVGEDEVEGERRSIVAEPDYALRRLVKLAHNAARDEIRANIEKRFKV